MKFSLNTNLKLPSISRFITELSVKRWAYALIISISFILSILIVLRLFELGRSMYVLRVASIQKEASKEQLGYWEGVIERFPGYRDAYFRAYLLAAKLSETDKAQKYMGELLRIDPGFRIPSGT